MNNEDISLTLRDSVLNTYTIIIIIGFALSVEKGTLLNAKNAFYRRNLFNRNC